MKLTRYLDPAEFYRAAAPFLTAAEVENNLILGVAASLENPLSSDSNVYLATVGKVPIVAVAMMTPPHHLVLSFPSRAGLRLILDDLLKSQTHLPGVLGPSDEADQFAQAWEEQTRGKAHLSMQMRVYKLEYVVPPPDVSGALRLATMDDLDVIAQWRAGFARDAEFDTHPDLERMRVQAQTTIAQQRLYLWEDEQPVSAVGRATTTPTGVRINMVYTPPEFRQHGYATAAVASLSQMLLDSGRKFCFLFTDLANPTSNSIYQKIGYAPVCDFHNYTFSI